MIIVKKNGYLQYKNFRFRCAIGKAGIKKKVREGDNITPKGTYKLINIFFRPDRIRDLKTVIKKNKITRKIGWCDEINSKYYNIAKKKLSKNTRLYCNKKNPLKKNIIGNTQEYKNKNRIISF